MGLVTCLAALVRADDAVYVDELAAGWSDGSWSADVDEEDALAVDLDEGGCLSLVRDAGFGDAAALGFRVRISDPALLTLELVAEDEDYATGARPLGDHAPVPAAEGWWAVTVDFAPLGRHRWDMLRMRAADKDDLAFELDDVMLLDTAPSATRWVGVEAAGGDGLLLHGAGDPSGVRVFLDDEPVGIVSVAALQDPPRAWLRLDRPLEGASLRVETADGGFERRIESAEVRIPAAPTHVIPSEVYGVARPSAEGVEPLEGAGLVRWGGNSTSLYNPFRLATNRGEDWYFENRVEVDAGLWVRDIQATGASAMLTVPALDHVARDATSWSYSIRLYGSQSDRDPRKPDAGNGVQYDGDVITWNDPADAYEPWTPADVTSWLSGVPDPPAIVSVGNELDIVSSTHPDVHPEPMTYDELLARHLQTADAVRAALPDVGIAGPSSCCWRTYWASLETDADRASHGGMDLLPWFLAEVARADAADGVRRLDYLDVHFYPSEAYDEDVDDVARAERLRSTRALWDPAYTDESWIGDPDQRIAEAQPSPHQVQLIPRMRRLVEKGYPGTGVGVSEWNWGAEGDLSGGLAAADALGIFGREGAGYAVYFGHPVPGSPVAAAFELYRDPALPFGDRGLPVPQDDPDRLGAYAAMDAAGRHTVVLLNKDPGRDLRVTGLPAGTWTMRHFGGRVGAALVDDGTTDVSGAVLVPAYSGVFLASEPKADAAVPEEKAPEPEAAAREKTETGCAQAAVVPVFLLWGARRAVRLRKGVRKRGQNPPHILFRKRIWGGV